MRLSEAIDLLDHPSLRALYPQVPASPGASAQPAALPPAQPGALSPTPPGSSVTTAPATPIRWADLGCGNGLFTEALARFLPAGSSIYGIDLRPQLHSDSVNGVTLIPLSGDFINTPILLKDLDGILMANSFHYVQDKPAFLHKLKDSLKTNTPSTGGNTARSTGGNTAPLLIVEYDTDRPVPTWVPWPISFARLQPLLQNAGWPRIEKLGELPSAFGGTMYAALAHSAALAHPETLG